MAGWINRAQQKRDHNGQRNTCAACGHEGTARNSLVKATGGARVHHSHTTDRKSGYYRQEQR